MIHVTAIYGSHRRNQNSDLLLDKVLEGIGVEGVTVQKIYAASKNIRHCTACESCYKDGRCVLRDEMDVFYEAVEKADIVVTATPVYFYTVTSELKKLIDRTQAVWASKYVLGGTSLSRKYRAGYIICTGGAPEEKSYFDCTLKVMDLFYKCINTKLESTMLVANVDKDMAKGRKGLLDEAVAAGRWLRGKVEENRK